MVTGFSLSGFYKHMECVLNKGQTHPRQQLPMWSLIFVSLFLSQPPSKNSLKLIYNSTFIPLTWFSQQKGRVLDQTIKPKLFPFHTHHFIYMYIHRCRRRAVNATYSMASTSRNIFCFKLLIEDHMAGLLTKEIWRIPIIPDGRFLDFSFVCLTIWWPAQQH